MHLLILFLSQLSLHGLTNINVNAFMDEYA